MKSIINELWHGNVCPQTDSRNNSPEMKELMEYMARHHEDLLKTMTDEQKRNLRKARRLLERVYDFSRGSHLYIRFQARSKVSDGNLTRNRIKHSGKDVKILAATFITKKLRFFIKPIDEIGEIWYNATTYRQGK